MYLVDAMEGFQFEAFLVEIFQTIGYDVKETKKTADQGADLFVTRFGKNMVIQAKNYSGSVGNAAVQQAICSGQLIPDTTLSFSSARAGGNPSLNWWGRIQL
ncbi:HJR/Mrr/RecB family endonuclease [Pseudomonas cedrina]|nr:HJR/Mrr/RecB family endonuclease [Pseudomonas cedrina]